MSEIPTRRTVRRTRWVIAVVVLLTYAYLFGADFTWWDDSGSIHQNPHLNPATWDSLRLYWTSPAYAIYIPLTYTVWIVLSLVARVPPGLDEITLNPAWYHAANILFHLLATWGVATVLRRLLRNEPAALIGALAFAVHPVQVESVAWISGLKDVMSGCFVIWAIAWFVRARQAGVDLADTADTTIMTPKGTDRVPTRPGVAYLISGVLFLLALLSKPSAMTLPAVVLLIDLLILRTPWKRAVRAAMVLGMIALPLAVVAKLAQPALTIVSPLWARPLVAMDSVAFYVGKILFPHPLVFDYGRTPTYVIQTGAVWWTPLITVGLLAGIAFLLRRGAWIPACGLLVAMAAPAHTLGLVRFEFQDVSTVADHYLYVAMLGVAIVVAWGGVRWRRARAVLVILLVLWGLRSAWQTRVWQDHPTLMAHGFHYTPHGKAPATNLASWALKRRDLPSAIKYSEIGLANTPNEPAALSNAGYVALILKEDDRARELFARYVSLYEARFGPDDPRTATAWVTAGEAFAGAGLVEDARRCAHHAHRIAPESSEVQALLKLIQTP